MMTLGEKIKALRKKKYTQEELAYRLGIHVNTLVRWERGDRNPTADKLKELASVLGTTANYLLDETDAPTPTAGNASNSEPASSGDTTPYTQAQTVNRGMLIYDLGNGKKIELPPTRDSYDFLRDIASRAAHVAVV